MNSVYVLMSCVYVLMNGVYVLMSCVDVLMNGVYVLMSCVDVLMSCVSRGFPTVIYGTLVPPHPALLLVSVPRLTPGSVPPPVCCSGLLCPEGSALLVPVGYCPPHILTPQHQEERDSSFQEQFQYFQRPQLL